MTRNGMQPDNLFYSVIDIQETFYKYFSADVSSLNRICRFLHLASSSSNTTAIFLFLVKALYLAGTTSPTSRFVFPITSTLIQYQQRIYHFIVPHLDYQ